MPCVIVLDVHFGSAVRAVYNIQLKVLTKIVLEDIRSKIQTIKLDEKRAREEFLKRNGEFSSRERKTNQKRLNQAKRRLSELDKLIASVYEDKVTGRIPEEVCFSLLDKYQGEKNSLKDEISVLERKASDNDKSQADVDEFIRRLKSYMEAPELTREMCMELIEFITVDECPGKYSKQPRGIHIYYKLIDKSASKKQFQSWENNK